MKHRLLLGTAPVLLLSLLLILAGADTIHAGTFNPTVRACLEDFSTPDPNPTTPGDPTECDGDTAAGAPSDLALGVEIASGDVNFGGLVTYIPNEWTVARGDEFPIGTRVGLVEAIATIGIINGACDNTLNLTTSTAGFQLFNSSLDINDTIDFDTEDEGDTTRQDWAEDLDEDGLKEFVTKYPDFINRLITDEDDNPQQPIRRSAGHLVIAGADVLLQYLVYEPGTFISKNLTNDPALGYPTVVTLQNLGDPEIVPEPGPITDFCTPLSSNVTLLGIGDACDSVVNDDPEDDDLVNDGCATLGTPESESEARDGSDPCANNIDDDRLDDLDFSRAAGLGEEARINDGCPQDGNSSEADIEYILYANPSEEGTYTIVTIAVGLPDADGDGIENTLDTCPFDVNLGDPRIKGDGDLDGDGLDAACDPDDSNINSDEDLDGYVNRQDNCPLIPNGEDTSNQADDDVDDDGDRQNDGIGDDCDPNPLVFDGEPLAERLRTLTVDLEIGPPGEGTPTDDETPSPSDGDDDGGGATIFIIIGIIAAVVVVGGGAFYFMRRGSGGTASGA